MRNLARTRVQTDGVDAGAFTNDHLHTPATELAGDASKAADGSADRSPSRRRGGRPRRLALLIAAVLVVAVAAGCGPISRYGGGDISQHPFLACTRRIESGGNYAAVNPSGKYRGAYQFSRSTWDSTARHAGWLDLAGVDPAAASPGDQDAMALHLYEWQGASPWGGRCA
jgi:hypothetical protein